MMPREDLSKKSVQLAHIPDGEQLPYSQATVGVNAGTSHMKKN
jgi:hypothetical protein